MKWVVWFIIISMNIVFGFFVMVLWFFCILIQKMWDLSVEGLCYLFNVLFVFVYVFGVYLVFCDFVLVLLLWMIILKL